MKVKSDSLDAKHGGPHGLALDGDRLVTGTYSDIMIFDTDLRKISQFSNEWLAGVHGLTLSENNIWVSSCNNEGVFKFDSTGQLLEDHFLLEMPEN